MVVGSGAKAQRSQIPWLLSQQSFCSSSSTSTLDVAFDGGLDSLGSTSGFEGLALRCLLLSTESEADDVGIVGQVSPAT